MVGSNALVKKNNFDTENNFFWRKTETYDKIVAERNNEIITLNYKINGFDRPLGLIRKIKNGSIDLEKARENQEEFRLNLGETTKRKWDHKSEEQKSTMNRIKVFYKAREKIIKLFDDYTTILCKTKYETKRVEGFKILTP